MISGECDMSDLLEFAKSAGEAIKKVASEAMNDPEVKKDTEKVIESTGKYFKKIGEELKSAKEKSEKDSDKK